VTVVLIVLAAAFGSLIGSFLNVVIHRLPLDQPLGLLRRTRSKCPNCDATIRWYDNIPLLSYLALAGRCRACRWRIPLRYPVVEAVTAALFALAALRAQQLPWHPRWLGFGVAAAFGAVCIAASAIDFQHKILPDKLTLRVGPVICLIGAVFVPGRAGDVDGFHRTALFGAELARMKPGEAGVNPGLASLVVGLAGVVVGAGVIYAIRWIGSLLVRREAMGLGDVKFMGMCGLLLGPEAALLAIGVAMVGGAVLGVLIWIVTRNREIPFGPFLALGALAVLLYGAQIDTFVFETYPGWVTGAATGY
jgi:leader peptidase (prepilin peptidase)/N-methyltransferase